jgi:hypothetical protein
MLPDDNSNSRVDVRKQTRRSFKSGESPPTTSQESANYAGPTILAGIALGLLASFMSQGK